VVADHQACVTPEEEGAQVLAALLAALAWVAEVAGLG
jgi:hypothetical protein